MRVKRSVLGLVGVLAWMLTAVLTTGSAQAAEPSNNGAGGNVRIAPSAPDSAQSAAQGVAAVSPTISPATRFIHVATGEPYTCDSGNFCGEVWDPVVSKWKVFFLYYCNRYALANWNGMGDYTNAQTGGAAATFYRQNGSVLGTAPAGTVEVPQDWTPVWYIRNC
ncbi:hypothetical protein [Streptomyces bluensis]|uniref:hypothetical protein n=1 Tax=Streptomyces bluensis TaxID=33897 RepID=UPI00332081D4